MTTHQAGGALARSAGNRKQRQPQKTEQLPGTVVPRCVEVPPACTCSPPTCLTKDAWVFLSAAPRGDDARVLTLHPRPWPPPPPATVMQSGAVAPPWGRLGGEDRPTALCWCRERSNPFLPPPTFASPAAPRRCSPRARRAQVPLLPRVCCLPLPCPRLRRAGCAHESTHARTHSKVSRQCSPIHPHTTHHTHTHTQRTHAHTHARTHPHTHTHTHTRTHARAHTCVRACVRAWCVVTRWAPWALLRVSCSPPYQSQAGC